MKRFSILLVLGLFVISCSSGSDSPSTPSEVFQGTFVLQSVSATDSGTTVTFSPPAVTGTLTVRPDNTYTSTMNWPEAGINNETSSGTWTLNGNQLTANDDDGTTETFTVSADQNQISLSMIEQGATATITFVRA